MTAPLRYAGSYGTRSRKGRKGRLIDRNESTARSRAIVENLPIVWAIAGKMRRGRDIEIDDLVQEGAIGLIDAEDTFDKRRGLIGLRRHMGALRRMQRYRKSAGCHTVRIPEYVVYKGGGTVSMVSLDRRQFSDGYGGESLVDYMVDTTADTEDDCLDRVAVERLLVRLLARERSVLIKRFGLDGSAPMTVQEIRKEIGVSRQTVNNILNRAFRKMRKAAGKDAAEFFT